MKRIYLNGVWKAESLPTGTQKKLVFDARVPGCVLNDLIHAGLAGKNVFWRDNAEQVQEYENYNWVYAKEFDVDNVQAHSLLVFERLDTYCDVYLNGRHLASAANGFIPHFFPLDGKLLAGKNRIEIYFYSPIQRVLGKKPLVGAFTSERMNTRRMQCTYGWDWTMRFVTCGIGADAYIAFPEDSLAVDDVYVYTKSIDEDSAEIGADITFSHFEKGEVLTFRVISPDGKTAYSRDKYCDEPMVRLNFDLVSPLLWYPNGYGEQPLYDFSVCAGEKELCRTRFGIRTVKILQLPDAPDSQNAEKCRRLKETPFAGEYDKNTSFSGFILKINGIRISCKGGNWVPCEPFVTEGIDRKVTRLLELAKGAGVNMIRVWGGGQFETEHFYDECSRLGIMVTQDFLMACGRYPEDDAAFLDELRREAEYAVRLMRNKPCLVWWSGDNENAINGCDTDADYPGRSSALKAIAPVLYREDPYRAFLPSSPYGGKNYASNTVGTTHNSQYLGYFFDHIENQPLDDYKEYFKLYNARFIAEEPTMGAVSELSLRKMMSDGDIYGESDAMWKYHMQTNPGLKKHLYDYLCDFAEKIFGSFADGKDRLFKLQYAHYEWVRVTLERMRREKWFCSGIIYWMLNDCWPASAGWSLIDYYCLPKASYYSFKRAAKPVMLSIDRHEDGGYRIYACSDSPAPCRATLRLYRINLQDGSCTPISERRLDIPANTVIVASDEKIPCDSSSLLCAELSDENGVLDIAFYKEGALPLVPVSDGCLEVIRVSDTEIRVSATRYIHAVRLTADAVFDDNDFPLLPGVSKTVRFTPTESAASPELHVTAYTVKA